MSGEEPLDGAVADPIFGCEILLKFAGLETGYKAGNLVVGEAVADAPDGRRNAVTIRTRGQHYVTDFVDLDAFVQVGGRGFTVS